jgi:hypothetical protein
MIHYTQEFQLKMTSKSFHLSLQNICAHYNGKQQCQRLSAKDEAAFEKLMVLHPKFSELISAFKNEPDGFDSFVVMVSNPKHSLSLYALNSWLDGV